MFPVDNNDLGIPWRPVLQDENRRGIPVVAMHHKQNKRS